MGIAVNPEGVLRLKFTNDITTRAYQTAINEIEALSQSTNFIFSADKKWIYYSLKNPNPKDPRSEIVGLFHLLGNNLGNLSKKFTMRKTEKELFPIHESFESPQWQNPPLKPSVSHSNSSLISFRNSSSSIGQERLSVSTPSLNQSPHKPQSSKKKGCCIIT
ncbi:MAG: hypothetical protein V4487_00500 [Chlamydiota bacterium]